MPTDNTFQPLSRCLTSTAFIYFFVFCFASPNKSDVNISVPFECCIFEDETHSNVKIKVPYKKKTKRIVFSFLQNGSLVLFVPQMEVPMRVWITQNWFKIPNFTMKTRDKEKRGENLLLVRVAHIQKKKIKKSRAN
ncbi:hypothetical protein XENORESO_008647 [Xenotaenia resolanae]|uniref:Autophagy-related protein 11 C-terminal domain-containing protein n=1 Tax=Xenotaenia resolanae TaxID=208358 RepID=A0ABV0WJC0_9TELE